MERTPDAEHLLNLLTPEEGVVEDGVGELGAVLGSIKSVPGNVSLESMMAEIGKLHAVRAVGLPVGLFADVAPKVLNGWRARAAVEARLRICADMLSPYPRNRAAVLQTS